MTHYDALKRCFLLYAFLLLTCSGFTGFTSKTSSILNDHQAQRAEYNMWVGQNKDNLEYLLGCVTVKLLIKSGNHHKWQIKVVSI